MTAVAGVDVPESTPVLTEAEQAFRRLAARLDELADTGRTWPCAADPERWFADDDADRAAAAEACRSCPALTACGDYAAAADERHGTWGGVDRSRRTTRRKEDDR